MVSCAVSAPARPSLTAFRAVPWRNMKGLSRCSPGELPREPPPPRAPAPSRGLPGAGRTVDFASAVQTPAELESRRSVRDRE